jgi:hypothetical protein
MRCGRGAASDCLPRDSTDSAGGRLPRLNPCLAGRADGAGNGCGGAGRPKMIKAREDAHHNFLIALIIFEGNQGDQIEYLGRQSR